MQRLLSPVSVTWFCFFSGFGSRAWEYTLFFLWRIVSLTLSRIRAPTFLSLSRSRIRMIVFSSVFSVYVSIFLRHHCTKYDWFSLTVHRRHYRTNGLGECTCFIWHTSFSSHFCWLTRGERARRSTVCECATIWSRDCRLNERIKNEKNSEDTLWIYVADNSREKFFSVGNADIRSKTSRSLTYIGWISTKHIWQSAKLPNSLTNLAKNHHFCVKAIDFIISAIANSKFYWSQQHLLKI